jgi:hypothetical protein
MFMSDKKKPAALIIAKMRSGKESMPEKAEQNEMGDEVDNMGIESAAEELLAAIEAKSPKAIVEAMKSMMEMMDSEEEMPEEA